MLAFIGLSRLSTGECQGPPRECGAIEPVRPARWRVIANMVGILAQQQVNDPAAQDRIDQRAVARHP